MSPPTAPRRRWYQFRLASLLWLMLFVPMCVFGIREHQRRVRLEAEAARLRAKVNRDQEVGLAAQHQLVEQLRRFYLEKEIARQNLEKQLKKPSETRECSR